MTHEPSQTLKNRSYVGLILSQFLAAFNDQATHIVAIFFAGDYLVRYVGVSWLDDKNVISMVTAMFLAPFVLFSGAAGTLADKYSKRNILVIWKMAEVGIMALVLLGFLLPHCASWNILSSQTLAEMSAFLVVSGVFLMGTHSAFFIPAKYGAMPELLHTSILSRGNGLLEGTSFTANILGTCFGGYLYSNLQSEIVTTSSGTELNPGREWIIGVVLLALAVVGALGSLLIERLPAAAPQSRFRWFPYGENFKMIRRSRSLVVAVTGIAFFAFMTLFMRQVLLSQGETNKELELQRALTMQTDGGSQAAAAINQADQHRRAQEAELRVAFLIGLVGLGVGIGCTLAGHLSGKKLELGLVLIGATFLVVTTGSLALAVHSEWATQVTLVLIGCAAGLYIVPMYTMLQQRAPKGSKGNLVATSNFVNVAGGLFAIAVFWLMTVALESGLDLNLDPQDVKKNPTLRSQFIEELERHSIVPRIQFFGASVITLGMIALMIRQRPDFLVRTVYWLRNYGREQSSLDGMHQLPGYGPQIVVANAPTLDEFLQIEAHTDRLMRFVLWNGPAATGAPHLSGTRALARRIGLVIEPATQTHSSDAVDTALQTLRDEYALLIAIPSSNDDAAWEFLEMVRRESQAPVVSMWCQRGPATSANGMSDQVLQDVQVGEPLPVGTGRQEILAAWDDLARPA